MLLSRFVSRRDVRTTRDRLSRRRPLVEFLEGRQLLATFTVTNVNDSGPGSLRQAIISSNATSGSATNTIKFQVGSGVQTIALQSALPTVVHAVTINATTQPGTGSAPRIVLDGTNAGADVSGITFETSNSSLKGVAVDNFSYFGVEVDGGSAITIADDYIGVTPAGTAAGNAHSAVVLCNGAHGNTVTGNVVSGNGGNGLEICTGASHNVVTANVVGTNPAGTAAMPNVGDAVKIETCADDNVIGGTAAGAGNLFSGNQANGVEIDDSATSNVVVGNLIGTDVTGTVALGNAETGVLIDRGAADNVIGGTAAGAGNVISGNGGDGIWINGNGVTGNIVQGNKIGTDVTGSVALGNGFWGVGIQEAARNSVGGSATGAGNLISGNSEGGVAILGVDAVGDVVQGNLIGTDVTGTQALGNAYSGVYVGDWGVSGDAASYAEIGGSAPGDGNVISANGNWGVWISGAGCKGNVVQGNEIGTNASGTAALGNALSGVMIDRGAANNVVGGTTAGSGNVISGNQERGVDIEGGSHGNVVEGNLIGTNASGTAALGNVDSGVLIGNGSNSNIIGGTTAGAENVISANGDRGVHITNGSDHNVVDGNLIGTTADGTAALGNGDSGVLIDNGSDCNIIGGTAAGAENVISGNGARGVHIANGSDQNVVEGNLIGMNAGGTAALGNDESGVLIDNGSDCNIIGGTTAGAKNVISGNGGDGVHISAGSDHNVVEGNLIGTNTSGTGALGNALDGVLIDNESADNVVGGTTACAANTIVNNLDSGVGLNDASTGNLIEGDVINANGFGAATAGLGDGVLVVNSSGSTVINNTIKSNRDWGIVIDCSNTTIHSGNTYQSNGLGDVHDA